MAIPTIYRWDDASAPQITRENISQLQALFQACLIDGYGAKAAPVSGANKWTIPFSDGTGFILQQGGTQSRKCGIKIYDIHGASGSSKVAAAVSWSDINTPITTFAAGGASDRIGTGFGTSTSHIIPWVIMATERTIYCQFGDNFNIVGTPVLFDTSIVLNMNNQHWIFGDYKPISGTQTFNQILIYQGPIGTTSDAFNKGFTTNSNTGTAGKKRLSGTFGNTDGSIIADVMYTRPNVLGAMSVGDFPTASLTNYTSRYKDGNLFVEDGIIVAINTIMGSLPGLKYPINTSPFAVNGAINSFLFGGLNYYIFGTGEGGQYFIHDGEWGVD